MVKDWEDVKALVAQEHRLAIIKALIEQAPRWLCRPRRGATSTTGSGRGATRAGPRDPSRALRGALVDRRAPRRDDAGARGAARARAALPAAAGRGGRRDRRRRQSRASRGSSPARRRRSPTAVVGVCQSELGLVASWLVEALNVVTGNFDRPGGMMFTKPAADIGPIARVVLGNHYGAGESRARPPRVPREPAVGGVVRGDDDARARANPRARHPRGEPGPLYPRWASAWRSRCRSSTRWFDRSVRERDDAPRRRHPPTGERARERRTTICSFTRSSVRNTTSYSEPVLPRGEDAKDDYEILLGLAAKLAGRRVGQGAIARAVERAVLAVAPSTDRVVDTLLRVGPYGDHYLPGKDGLSLAKVRAAKHGIDLGPMVPMGRERIRTPGGLVHLAPDVFVPTSRASNAGSPRVRAESCSVIGRRHLRSNNSWMHNLRSLVKGPGSLGALIHPDDARALRGRRTAGGVA